MKLNKIIIFLLLLFLPDFCSATPNITSTSGTISDEQPCTITGSGFTTNTLDIEWLGGSNGNIEQGSGDFAKSGWSADTTATGFQAPQYTNEKAHSGSQSILSSYPLVTDYGSGFQYNHDSTFDSIYVTYWVYFNHVDSEGQWKMWRISAENTYNNSDGEIMTAQWYTASGGFFQSYILLFCDWDSYDQCYPDGDSDQLWLSSDTIITPGTWIRIEVYAEGSSIGGVSDGTLYNTMSREGETTLVRKNFNNNIMTRLDGGLKWRYFIFQNYWGNITEGDGTGEKIYIDDVYLYRPIYRDRVYRLPDLQIRIRIRM